MASCSAVSALRKMGANLVPPAGLSLPNISQIGEVSYSSIVTIDCSVNKLLLN